MTRHFEHAHDLRISNARLRDGQIATLTIDDGQVIGLGEALPNPVCEEIDARGQLVTESYCNPHLHLDKVHSLSELGDAAMADYHGSSMGKAMTAIERAAAVKLEYDGERARSRIEDALEAALAHGNTHIRALADVDPTIGLAGVHALVAARERFAGRLSLQVVAFPQEGILREPGTRELLMEAMSAGADVIGGIPWIEYTDDDARQHVDIVFDIAQQFDADVSMLVDDAGDANLKTTEMMAVAALERGWHGRVLAHHARAMQLYPEPYLQKLLALLKRAKMAVVSDPHTGPLHARVRELLAADCLVALGQDDISDAYYPFGRNNMLEVGFLAAHLLWMTSATELEQVYDMITTFAGRAMGMHDHALALGHPANLVVLDVPDVLEAFRYHRKPSCVVHRGRIVSAA